MNACCRAANERGAPPRPRCIREILAWLLSGALLLLVPKCPACLAAQVALWSGVGLSFSTAAWLRWGLLLLAAAALLLLVAQRLDRIRAMYRDRKQENGPCTTR